MRASESVSVCVRATMRGGTGEEGGEGGRESEIVREEKRSASMSMSAALRLGEPCLCGLFQFLLIMSNVLMECSWGVGRNEVRNPGRGAIFHLSPLPPV